MNPSFTTDTPSLAELRANEQIATLQAQLADCQNAHQHQVELCGEYLREIERQRTRADQEEMAAARYAKTVWELRETIRACSVFTTPLERLKGWNEFKEDAARRMNAAMEQTDSRTNTQMDPADDPTRLRAGIEMLKRSAAQWLNERDAARAEVKRLTES